MTALPSLKQLRYLVALSDQLNFTRAAESCFVTQSTLSAGLKELEKVLGTQLVERDRTKMLMTPIGLSLVEQARAIVAATQDLVELAIGARKPMTGLLRLGVIPTIAPFLLPHSLQLLRERYPTLHLALREDVTVNLLSRLEDGQLDLALIALPYDTANLMVKPLFDDELWIVGRKRDPQVKARVVHVTASLTERLILLEEGHCLRDHALYACGASTRRSAEGVEATSLLTLVQMVESGLGIGLVPEMAVKSGLTDSPNLVSRPMAKPSPKRTIALVARRSTTRLADLKALAEVVRSVRASERPGSTKPHVAR
jgi:LysR family transcriptional regulator, hydrogen peroxide-inducible genes activator